MSKTDSQSGDFWGGVGAVYGIGALISMMYFEWQFAAQNGFAAWLLFGWIVPALKALIWPFYILPLFFGR